MAYIGKHMTYIQSTYKMYLSSLPTNFVTSPSESQGAIG
jgi:hypothetical protein